MYDRLEKIDGPECPDCGCPQSRVMASRPSQTGSAEDGTLALWTVERRECANCGAQFTWQFERADEPDEPEPDRGPVLYQPVRCPRCASKRTPVRSTRGQIRHHLCSECGLRFKSAEVGGEERKPVSKLRRSRAD